MDVFYIFFISFPLPTAINGIDRFGFASIGKIVVIFIDIAWLTLGAVWLVKFYIAAPTGEAKEIMLGK